MKKIALLFVSVLLFAGTSLAEGISSAKELVAFITAANAGEDTTPWTDRDGVISLKADIDLGKVKNFVPVTMFDGVFDGCGHSILNWKAEAGLFHIVSEHAVVRNLTIDESCSMKCVDNNVQEEFYAGFIADVNLGTLENCVNRGTISHRSAKSLMPNYVGGVCGMNKYVIMNCDNYGNISSSGNFGGNLDNRGSFISLGGVVGGSPNRPEPCAFIGYCDNHGMVTYSGAFPGNYIGGVIGNSSRAKVKFCVNRGNLTVAAKSISESDVPQGLQAGGVCGLTKGDVVCCDNFGELITRCDIFTMLGGICGSTHFALTVGDCVNYADVTASGYKGASVGGIVGQAARPIVAVQCINKGNVKFSGESPKTRSALGGIIGNAFVKRESKYAVAVIECHNEGDVSCGYAANTYNSVRGIHVGGLCGFMAGNETVNAAMRYSTNTGRISSEAGRLGGIAALSSFNDIQECTNEGEVTGSPSVAGGICGVFEAGEMRECTNTGDVLVKGRGNAGGIAGTTKAAQPTSFVDCRNSGAVCGRFGFAASILAESVNPTDRVDGCGVGGAVGTPSQDRESAAPITEENYTIYILGRNAERNNAVVGEKKPCYYWNGTK